MKLRTLLLLSFILLKEKGFCQDVLIKPDSSILLETAQGKKLLEDCSGSYYQNLVDSFWIPNSEEYKKLESNFYKLNTQVKNPKDYIIQYVGIILDEKKYIYINAFHKSDLADVLRVHKDLSISPVVVCGGGYYFWRVLFDPSLKEFTEVKINAPK